MNNDDALIQAKSIIDNGFDKDLFQSVPFPDKIKLRDAVTVLSCQVQGKTYGEAQKKRKPIDKIQEGMTRIIEAEARAWIEGA